MDFDPQAVKVARRNVRRNEVSLVKISEVDVLDWSPERKWPVVVANLFSTITSASISPLLLRLWRKRAILSFQASSTTNGMKPMLLLKNRAFVFPNCAQRQVDDSSRHLFPITWVQ